MLILFCKRLLQLIPVLWGVGTIVFFLLRMVPGDPVDIMLGESAQAANKEALRASLHLDKPLSEQYWLFWKNTLKGDLGESFLTKRKISELIAERFPATASLALLSLLWALCMAIPLGIWAAAKAGTFWDNTILFGTLLGVSLPSFWLGPLLMLFFSVKLGWLPVSERGGPETYFLPSFTLGLAMAAILTRMTRTSLLESLQQDYIITARSKGLSEHKVFLKHALKNSLMPVITVLGLQLGGLFAGTVITETIFDWPGIGELIYRAIQNRDYPLVQACVLVIACTYVAANFVADLAYQWANPRVEEE